MKLLSLVVLCFASAGATRASDSDVGAPDPSVSGTVASRILSADHATMSSLSDKSSDHAETVVIRDKHWIERFASAVRAGEFSPRMHIFAVSSPVVFLDGKDHICTSIELLPGNTLRVGAQDYQVDDKTMKAVSSLLREQKL